VGAASAGRGTYRGSDEGRPSRYDIGDQLIFDPDNLVLERQFLPFQSLHRQRVRAARCGQRVNGVIQIPMFLPQHLQADAQHLFEIEFG
jgi:hypothetical protein